MNDELEIKDHKLELIENQIYLIQCLLDTDNSVYDDFLDDKIKTIVRAFKVINKAQEKIIKEM